MIANSQSKYLLTFVEIVFCFTLVCVNSLESMCKVEHVLVLLCTYLVQGYIACSRSPRRRDGGPNRRWMMSRKCKWCTFRRCYLEKPKSLPRVDLYAMSLCLTTLMHLEGRSDPYSNTSKYTYSIYETYSSRFVVYFIEAMGLLLLQNIFGAFRTIVYTAADLLLMQVYEVIHLEYS